MLKKLCSVFLAVIMMMSLVLSASAEIFYINTFEEGNLPAKNVVIAQGHAFVVCGKGDKPDTINIYELATKKLVASLAEPVYTTGKNYFVEGMYHAGEYMYISWNRNNSSGDPSVKRYKIEDMLSGKLESLSGKGARGDKQSCVYDNKLFYTDPKLKILYYINTNTDSQKTVMSLANLDQTVLEKELVTFCADANFFYMVFPKEIRVYETKNMYEGLMQNFDETVAVYKTDETISDTILHDGRLYVLKDDGMEIFIASTNELKKLGSYKEGGKIMAFTPKNETAYVYADGLKSIQVLDISSPENIFVTEEVKINNPESKGVASIALDGQKIYAADLTDGFTMYSKNELDKFETEKKAESYTEELEMSEYGKAIELVVGLKIMSLRETGLFAPESYITRGEFAAACAKLLGDEAAETVPSNIFSDVPVDSKYASGICALSNLGIISGFSDGTFRPDEAIVFDHAVAVMVKIMGYYPIVQATGKSVLLVASDIDILDKVVSMGKNNISRGAAAKLIYNALTEQTISLSSFGESADGYIQSGTLLDKMNIKKARGRVTATEFTSVLGDEPAREGRVIIDGGNYLEGSSGASSYLGRNITYYYKYDKETQDSEVIFVLPADDDVIRIDAKHVSPSTTKTVFAYYDESDTLIKENIKNASIIFNGKFLEKYTADDLVPDDGEVVILDSDSDGEIDALIITSYETYIVSDYGRGIFKLMYGYDDIDLAKVDRTAKKSSVIVDGVRYEKWEEATGIKTWSVLSVLRSRDNDICEIYVTNSQVPAMVTGFEGDNVGLDDASYELSKVYEKNISKPDDAAKAVQLGDDVFACFDMFGKVAGFKINNLDAQYGYLMACDKEDKFDESKTFFRILVRDENYIFGSIKLFDGTETIKINGEKVKDLYDVSCLWGDKGTKKQLVKFVLNHDGKIKELYTAKDRITKPTDTAPNPDYVANYKGYDEHNFTYDATIKSSNAYRSTLGTFEGEPYTLNTSTALFLIPSGEGAKESEYKVMDAKAMFYSTTTLDENAHFYDVSADYIISALVLRTDSNSKPIDVVKSTGNVIIVDSFVKSLDEDGEMRMMVQSTKDADGKQKKEILASEDLVDETGGIANDKYLGMKMTDLPKGSAVQYARDGYGEIAAIRILYVPTDKNEYFEFALPRIDKTYLGMEFYTTFAKVIKVTSGNRLIFNGNNTGILKDANDKAVVWDGDLETANREWDRNLSLSSVSNIYVFDKATKKLTQINSSDLLPNDDILLVMKNSEIKMIVVYR